MKLLIKRAQQALKKKIKIAEGKYAGFVATYSWNIIQSHVIIISSSRSRKTLRAFKFSRFISAIKRRAKFSSYSVLIHMYARYSPTLTPQDQQCLTGIMLMRVLTSEVGCRVDNLDPLSYLFHDRVSRTCVLLLLLRAHKSARFSRHKKLAICQNRPLNVHIRCFAYTHFFSFPFLR